MRLDGSALPSHWRICRQSFPAHRRLPGVLPSSGGRVRPVRDAPFGGNSPARSSMSRKSGALADRWAQTYIPSARLGGTLWRIQGVVLRMLHGLPGAPVDRATHRPSITAPVDRYCVGHLPPNNVRLRERSHAGLCRKTPYPSAFPPFYGRHWGQPLQKMDFPTEPSSLCPDRARRMSLTSRVRRSR